MKSQKTDWFAGGFGHSEYRTDTGYWAKVPFFTVDEIVMLSPGWSIHSGAGTGRYSFIWSMAGDNQDFTDMDFVEMKDLR